MINSPKNANVESHTFDQRELRLVILSDTHGYLDENIAALIRDADIAIHAGDVMDALVLEQVQPKLKTIVVAGNNDIHGLWCSKSNDYVSQLPACARLQLPGGDIVVEHGHRFGSNQPDHVQLRKAHPEARLIVYGHTHKQIVEQEMSPWIANPGAAGLVRNQGGPRCLMLHVQGDDWQFEPHIFLQPAA